MDYFNYRENGQLFAEGCNLSELAAQHGTPLYVYSRATLERHWHAFDQAAGDVPHLICYAVKANGNLAILNLLTPIILLVMAINNDLFRYGGGRMIAAFILVWLVIAFVSWLGFQIWWNRREKVYAAATAHDDFVAIPVFSHFIQTFGEWAGMFVGIGGALLTLIAAIFLNGDASMLRMMGTGAFFGSGSLIYIVLNPIYGFIIVVVTRAAAETFRALAAIANNTKKS